MVEKNTLFHFLINPISGGGLGHEVHDFLPQIMDSMGFQAHQWKAEFTSKEGSTQQAQAALMTSEHVIAVGGDGTVSTILNALHSLQAFHHAKIGLIPLGTGNDLARVLGIYQVYMNRGLLYLVRKLVQSSSRSFDLWKVNGQYAMANYFSCGLDARIAHDFNRDRSQGRVMGNSAFANKVHYVRRFVGDRRYRLGKAALRYCGMDGEWYRHDVSGHRTVILGNIPSFAGGSNPFVKSDMSDGLLEVVPVPSLFRFLGGVGLGTQFSKVFTPNLKAKEVILELEPHEYVQLDGEDLTSQLGERIHVQWSGRVQMLYLKA